MKSYKMLFLIIGVLVAAFLHHRRNEALWQLEDKEYASTHPGKDPATRPSEDVSYILDQSKLSFPAETAQKTTNKVVKDEQLVVELTQDAIICLKSDATFDGIKIWDALRCLGLEWGDGDIFHWENEQKGVGPQQIFSVWTTTDPGYFLPQQIAEGTMKPQDLVFGFVVPRTPDPVHVYEAMLSAARYCRQRLGGELVNSAGLPLNPELDKQAIIDLVAKMKPHGMVPGDRRSLEWF